MIPIQVQAKLNEVAERYAQRLLQDVNKALMRLRRSGELVESLELTVTKATAQEAPKIVLTYADQGYFIGQRSPQWTRLPDISKLEEWAKGVELNGPVPGYKNGTAPNLPPWKAKQRKIWAIAKSKQKFDKHKRKPWKRAARIGPLISNLNEETLAAYEQEMAALLNASLEGRITS